MFKKTLLLGAALACLTTGADARYTGFYVGIQGTANWSQFKIYDASSHRGTTVTKKYTLTGTADTPAGEPCYMMFHLGGFGENDTFTIKVPDELIENEDFEATPNYQYRIRPSGAFFIGYNYQIGSNFIVGLELSAGMTFGSHKFHEYTRTCDLKHWGVSGDGAAAVNKEKTDSPVNDILMHQFEIETKFTGDASLRLGCILPGTNGKMALFIRGGAGLTNREISSTLIGSKEFYSSAIFDAFYREGEAAYTRAEVPEADGTIPLANRYRGRAYRYMVDPCYYAYKMHDPEALGSETAFEDDTKDPAQANDIQYYAYEVLKAMLQSGKTGDKLQVFGFDNDFNVEDSETEWSWHVGADLEYHWCCGAFVRASYTFKYLKGFFVEQSQNVKSPSWNSVKTVLRKQIADGLFDGMVAKSTFNDADATKNTAVKTALTGENMANLFDNCFTTDDGQPNKDLNDRFDLGTVNYKVGLGDKSFVHEFSLGVGYKF